jgi:copper oxidase (laccase) domain-containing protein
VLKFTPCPQLQILVSEAQNGNFNQVEAVREQLRQFDQGNNIIYFHHQQQAGRYWQTQTSVSKLASDNIAKYNSQDHENSNLKTKRWQEVEADAALTGSPQTWLAMKVADCFPVALYHPERPLLALIHAGWKPLLQNILELTIQDIALQVSAEQIASRQIDSRQTRGSSECTDIKPTSSGLHDPARASKFLSQLKAWIGPGIRRCCYHFTQRPLQAGLTTWKQAVSKLEAGSSSRTEPQWSIDLPLFIKSELRRLGLESSNIIDSQLCTCCCRVQDLKQNKKAQQQPALDQKENSVIKENSAINANAAQTQAKRQNSFAFHSYHRTHGAERIMVAARMRSRDGAHFTQMGLNTLPRKSRS